MKSLYLSIVLFGVSVQAFAQDYQNPECKKYDKYEVLTTQTSKIMNFSQEQNNKVTNQDQLQNKNTNSADVEKDVEKNCDPIGLYYGYQNIINYQQAKDCSLSKIANPDLDDNAAEFEAPAVLAMMYANANGVEQDYNISLHYICVAGGSPAEIDGRIAHLEKLQKRKVEKPNFDFCDDITSGYMEGWCANRDYQLDNIKKKKNIAEITNNIPQTSINAFEELQADSYNFYEEHAENEVEQDSTAADAHFIIEKSSQEDEFLTDMLNFIKNQPPHYNQDDFKKSDDELNKIYIKTLKDLKENGYEGGVTIKKIKDTQRIWLSIQKNLIDDYIKIFPQTDTLTWQTYLIKSRIKQLKSIDGIN